MSKRLVAHAIVSIFLMANLALGQAITASLHGRASDASGAVLPNATLTATNTETGLARTTTADDNGQYSISSLPAGNYKVEVQAGTFQPQTRTVPLTVGQS